MQLRPSGTPTAASPTGDSAMPTGDSAMPTSDSGVPTGSGVPGPTDAAAARHPALDWGLPVVVVLLVVAVALRPLLAAEFARPAVANWATIFVAIAVQAMPFLALGVAVSGAIAAFVPPALLGRLLPRSVGLAVPVAALAGAALPGCECGSIPVARRLIARGVAPSAALTFLLAAPAINPVVLVSTAVAFPGRPVMVLARFLGGLAAAVSVGLIWAATGDDRLLARAARTEHADGSRWAVFAATAQADLLSAGGFLVIGAAAAATLQTVVPRGAVDAFAGSPVLGVLALAALAVLLSICSEADAFVAAGLRQFSLTARLVFLVVGPMVDLKLVALHAGTFGRRFTVRFAPLALVCAIAAGSLVGWWLL